MNCTGCEARSVQRRGRLLRSELSTTRVHPQPVSEVLRGLLVDVAYTNVLRIMYHTYHSATEALFPTAEE